MSSWIVLGLSVSLLAICVPLVAQEPCTIAVKPGESIQAAINSAPDSSVILLRAGEWREHLVITKPLVLCGLGGDVTTIRGDAYEPVVRISAPDGEDILVVLSHLRITGAMGWEGFGVGVSGTARVLITECTLSGNETAGLWLMESAQVVVVASEVSHSVFGMVLTDTTRAAVVSCQFSANPWGGIVVGGTASGTITDSTITGSDSFGVAVGGASHTTITRCTISGNVYGIGIGEAAHVVMEDNRIVDNIAFDVMLTESPCFVGEGEIPAPFTGYVAGARNSITGLGMPEGSAAGSLCPEPDLGFLGTDEGGELDRRE